MAQDEDTVPQSCSILPVPAHVLLRSLSIWNRQEPVPTDRTSCPAIPTGHAPRVRGGCSPAVALQDSCPLVMAGLHGGGCPIQDLLLRWGP